MATIKRFEDLEIWQLAGELLNLIYEDFRNQIIAAGLSIKKNIVEGFSRDSDKEFKQLLNISRGSDGEVKSMYYTAEDQHCVTLKVAEDRRTRIDILYRKITHFMDFLKK
jgi:four helix bundle protein